MIACVYYHPQKTVVAHWNVAPLQVPTLHFYEELASDTAFLLPPHIENTYVCVHSVASIPLLVPCVESTPLSEIIKSEQQLWFDSELSFVEQLHTSLDAPSVPFLLSPAVATTEYAVSNVYTDVLATVRVFKAFTEQYGRSIAIGMLSGRIWKFELSTDSHNVYVSWLTPKQQLETELLNAIASIEHNNSNPHPNILLFGDGITKMMIRSLQQQTSSRIGRLNPFFGVHSALPQDQQKRCLQHAHLLSAIVSPVVVCESLAVA